MRILRTSGTKLTAARVIFIGALNTTIDTYTKFLQAEMIKGKSKIKQEYKKLINWLEKKYFVLPGV